MRTGAIHEAKNKGIIKLQDNKIKPAVKIRIYSSLNLLCKDKSTHQKMDYLNLLKTKTNNNYYVIFI